MKFLKKFFFIVSVALLFAFPKGGLKIGGIPLTWGYLILFVSGPFYFLNSIKTGNIYFTKPRRQVLLLCLPFIVYSGLVILLVPNDVSLGFLISYILSVLIMPFLFLFFLNKIFDTSFFINNFDNVFINCIRFVVVFGLIIYVQNRLTGSNIEIPYLTVNIDDVGTIGEKYNMRGDFMKYTSTYNNGNIFGVCMLILMPLYFQLEKRNVLKMLFIATLVLTLSRTAWIGMILYFFLSFFGSIKTVKGWMILFAIITALLVLLPVVLSFGGLDFDFLVDTNLGGRAGYLKVFDNPTLFGVGHFSGISEIVYTSIFENFGIIGLVLFFLYISSPVIVYYVNNKLNNKINKSHWGLIIYIIISASDGAMLFIPTMAFFWFISSVTLKPEN